MIVPLSVRCTSSALAKNDPGLFAERDPLPRRAPGLPQARVCGAALPAYCGGGWRRLSRSFVAGETSVWWWTIFHSPPSRRYMLVTRCLHGTRSPAIESPFPLCMHARHKKPAHLTSLAQCSGGVNLTKHGNRIQSLTGTPRIAILQPVL